MTSHRFICSSPKQFESEICMLETMIGIFDGVCVGLKKPHYGVRSMGMALTGDVLAFRVR